MVHLSLCYTFFLSVEADFIIELVGAVAGIGGAYVIYLLSIWQIRRDRLRYIASLLQTIVPSIKRQAGYCREHAENLIQNPYANLELKFEANRDTKRIADKVDQEGVYHAYLWKYKRKEKTYKDFKNLYAYIDYLDSLIDDLVTTNERILHGMWERKNHYRIGFTKVKGLIQSIAVNDELKQSHRELVEFAIGTMKKFLQKETGGENLNLSYEDVVNPIRGFIVEKVKAHPPVTEIYVLLDDLTSIYYGIELQVKHNARDYIYYADALDEKVVELEENSRQILKDFTVKR